MQWLRLNMDFITLLWFFVMLVFIVIDHIRIRYLEDDVDILTQQLVTFMDALCEEEEKEGE